MSVFNIFLIDYTFKAIERHRESAIADLEPRKSGIASRLQLHFSSICDTTNYHPMVQWVPEPGNVGRNELVCYFVEEMAYSIIFRNGWALSLASGTADGGTVIAPGNQTISEIYVDRHINYPNEMADLCLHELMHNKLEWGRSGAREFIHNHDDIHGGMGRTRLGVNERLSLWDINQMRASLGRQQPQKLVRKSDYLECLRHPRYARE